MENSQLLIACDPGATGAYAVFIDGELKDLIPASINPEWFKTFLKCLDTYPKHQVTCVIEQVHGIRGQAAASTFAFGSAYGASMLWLSYLGGVGCVASVAPATWMRVLGVEAGLEHRVRKNRIAQIVRAVFPNANITVANADAVGLGLACLREPELLKTTFNLEKEVNYHRYRGRLASNPYK